jgi:hypothetical protein
MAKIALLIPDYFWSSIPYDGLMLYNYLAKTFDIDLIMFKADIRLNKKKFPGQKFEFNRSHFNVPNLVKIDNWANLVKISKNYKLIISTVHLAPKNRNPTEELKKSLKSALNCKTFIIDIGGSDVLVNIDKADYLCVKGEIWKDWIVKMGFPKKNVFVTGIPQYDFYLHSDKLEFKILSKKELYKKYKIQKKHILLVTPSNPSNHKKHFESNIDALKYLDLKAGEHDYQLVIKTYPHDYIFHEEELVYSGIIKKCYSRHRPQYEVLQNMTKNAIILDSHDHFSAIKYARKLFNMSGSHVAWETYFTDCNAYSMNYEKQEYFGGAKYLPDYVKLPDEYININISHVDSIFKKGLEPNKKTCSEYFSTEFSLENIKKALESIL